MKVTTYDQVAELLGKAACPEDVFGENTYRDLARLCHPDQHNANVARHKEAEDLFQRLGTLRAQYDYKVGRGTFGNRLAAGKPLSPMAPTKLSVKGQGLTLTSVLSETPFATLYRAESEREKSTAHLVRVARTPKDNDLIEQEWMVLTDLYRPSSDSRREAFFTRQRNYVPRPLSQFTLTGPDRTKHRCNWLAVPLGRSFTAAQLLDPLFPKGIEAKHTYWICRRLLLTIWMGHLREWVNGGVLPNSVLVYPEAHGLVLTDWDRAVRLGKERISAVTTNPNLNEFYPPEVWAREPATVSTDIYMTVKTVCFLLGDFPPVHGTGKAVEALPPTVRATVQNAFVLNRRPQDAEKYHNELGDAIRRDTGPLTFSKMELPAGAP